MQIKSPEIQYMEIMKDIIEHGIDVKNERTGAVCRTLLNQRIQFDGNIFPILTTRKCHWKSAICEMIAYIRGYDNLEQFHSLGVKTWDANVQHWQSPHKLDENHAGIIYGKSAEVVGIPFYKIVHDIMRTPNDRGIIWNFWNPEYFPLGCLRPCMFNHQFNVLGDTLHLTSTQRSCDFPLGGAFNIIQCWFLLNVVAKLTNLKVGTVTWNISNVHIYENQIPFAIEQIKRIPYNNPTIRVSEDFDFDVLISKLDKDNFDDYFKLENYEHHPAIKYPFTV